jgi:hypothetical protein
LKGFGPATSTFRAKGRREFNRPKMPVCTETGVYDRDEE